MTYLITFACYGRHLHGEEGGSVDRRHNLPGGPLAEANRGRLATALRLMGQAPYELDFARRETVLEALRERCSERGWRLLAAHVRPTHVHVVVVAEAPPERIMNDLKAYASRLLNQRGYDDPARKRWARHGSTLWLREPVNVTAAIDYVVRQQGDPMAVFEAELQ